MQAQAAESSGYAGQFCCFFGREIYNSLSHSTISKKAVNQTRKRLVYTYLARK
jgi:hypothetical protein